MLSVIKRKRKTLRCYAYSFGERKMINDEILNTYTLIEE